MFRGGGGDGGGGGAAAAEPPVELLEMVIDVCACSDSKARRAMMLAGNDVATAIDLVLNGHPELIQSPHGGPAESRFVAQEDLAGLGEMEPDDLIELINWGLSDNAAKHALLRNEFRRQVAIEWWFGLPEG